MTPFQYYYWIRSVHGYRPPFAAMATLSRFCDSREEYWERVQRISDWLNKRNRNDVAILADEDTGYEYVYGERVYSDSICSDCKHLRWINPDEFYAECEEAFMGVNWPGRTNEDGDVVACQQFRPIGSEPT